MLNAGDTLEGRTEGSEDGRDSEALLSGGSTLDGTAGSELSGGGNAVLFNNGAVETLDGRMVGTEADIEGNKVDAEGSKVLFNGGETLDGRVVGTEAGIEGSKLLFNNGAETLDGRIVASEDGAEGSAVELSETGGGTELSGGMITLVSVVLPEGCVVADMGVEKLVMLTGGTWPDVGTVELVRFPVGSEVSGTEMLFKVEEAETFTGVVALGKMVMVVGRVIVTVT